MYVYIYTNIYIYIYLVVQENVDNVLCLSYWGKTFLENVLNDF